MAEKPLVPTDSDMKKEQTLSMALQRACDLLSFTLGTKNGSLMCPGGYRTKFINDGEKPLQVDFLQ
jgi:hypothetical protein